ncbi:LLM class F420-dependent oxidoreductase [Sinosporangium siamense]|uniref:LLM class F420-dependent oxidoreductase n=1 Tax=Sinosporangium siamense TaxID=1367973 RepID=A0A919V798_9ACTN|nr:LLM class F420-dependent oxidoreductase [Sinosporangium siamense]GII91862.1 LLM class F420-dependent oxidoreductase [Sinosporangium siamense]
MRIGVMLKESSGEDPLSSIERQIARAAGDGFASVWMSHIFGFDAITALAVAGRGVSGIELGTAVVPTYPRHPAAMAQQALTAGAALRGRFTLGIGLSHRVVIEGMFGYSFDKPARHMREYLSVLLPLLNGERVAFEGETLRADIGLTAPAAPAMPVLIAALAPRMLKLAGELADGTVLWMTGRKAVAEHIAPTITKAAREAGRPEPRIACGLPISVTDDVEAARAKADEVFAMYGQLPSYRAMLDREGVASPGQVAVVGDEESVGRQLDDLAAAGATDFMASPYGSRETVGRTLELLKSRL